jgi:hypothetical protein
MGDFDSKWQACAARARQAAARDDTAPLGFATRVLAFARQRSTPSPESIWERLALRSLAGALALLAVCAVFELPHFRDSRPLAPGVENTIAQLVWSL